MCFYKWLMNVKAENLNIDIQNFINIITEYNLFSQIKFIPLSETTKFFKTVVGDKTNYDLYVDSFHYHVSISDKEKIYSIRIKQNSVEWEFADDVSHPTNQYLEIYVWYDVPVLNIRRTTGYDYKSGKWDKLLAKNMDFLKKYLQQFTIEYKISSE